MYNAGDMYHWLISLNDATKALLTAALTLITTIFVGIGWIIKRFFDKKDPVNTKTSYRKSPITKQTGIKNEVTNTISGNE